MEARGVATRMTEISFAPQTLPHRAVVRITGEGTLAFLHNLLTCELVTLQAGQAAYGALLSPQGKILHDVFVMATTDGALIDCQGDQAEDLLKKLMMYRLRAKLTIALDAMLDVVAASEQLPDGYVDPRLPAIGYRAFRPRGLTPSGESYNEARLSLGLADSSDIGSNVHFPHEANFDQMNGVSFSKGCYVGQEVVSRMQHRSTARSRILPVIYDAEAPAKGAAIHSGETVIGEMLSSSGQQALALLRLDRLVEAKVPLLSGAVKLRVHKPDWIQYVVAIPEAAQ
jgi:tRNA-modifying protein YgfZ